MIAAALTKNCDGERSQSHGKRDDRDNEGNLKLAPHLLLKLCLRPQLLGEDLKLLRDTFDDLAGANRPLLYFQDSVLRPRRIV